MGGTAGRGPMGGFGNPHLEDARRQRPRKKGTLKRVATLYASYRTQLIIVAALVLITSILGVITPILIQQLIDQALPQQDLNLLLILISGMIIAAALTGILNLVQSRMNAAVGFKVMEDMRHALYSHLLKQPLSFFSTRRTGDIQSRLANDVSSTQLVLTDTVVNILSSVTVVAASLVAMIILSWELTLVAICTMPIFAYLSKIVGQRRRRLTSQMQRALAELTAKTGETLFVSGVIVAKTFGREEQQRQEFQDTNTRLTDLSIRQYMTGRGFFVLVQAFFTMAPAFVWLIGGILIIDGSDRVSLGDIVAFTTIQARLLFPMANLLLRGVEISGSLALFERIFEYMDIKPTIVDPVKPRYVNPSTAKGEVTFQDVTFTYTPSALDTSQILNNSASPSMQNRGRPSLSPLQDNGASPSHAPAAKPTSQPEATPVNAVTNIEEDLFSIENISFTAKAGELTALVGPSGSGKTTIGYLASRLYDTDAGAVKVDGVDVKDITQENLHNLIGVVSQSPFLFHASVRENMLYGRPTADYHEIIEAAKAAQIHETINAMPDGYETVVGEHGYRLSGGERQRLAIARVILADPKILLLDEATSSLDTLSERLIQQAITELRKGRTTIAIAHRLSTVIAAEQILVIQNGEITERGTNEELLKASDLYRKLYQEQFYGGHNNIPV